MTDLPRTFRDSIPALSALPMIMASCDGIVYDSSSGAAIKAVEAKHRCPFVPSSANSFQFRGSAAGALEDIPVDYFCQCQLQMLVQDLTQCDLVSYSLAGSRVFTIPRDDTWLALALQLLAHLQEKYICTQQIPAADILSIEAPQLFRRFMEQTKLALLTSQGRPGIEVPSSISTTASDIFLDGMPENDPRKQEAGEKRAQQNMCMHACMHETRNSNFCQASLDCQLPCLRNTSVIFAH